MNASQRLKISLPYILALGAFFLFCLSVYWSFTSPYDGLIDLDMSTGLIKGIDPQGPAFNKLEKNDLILSVDGVPAEELLAVFSGKRVGDEVKLQVLRDGLIIERILQASQPNAEEILIRLISLLVGLCFWGAGVGVLAFAPQNPVRNLFFVFSQASALLLISGHISTYGFWWASVLFNILLWLIGPVTVHFHLHFPHDMANRGPRILIWLLYVTATSVVIPYLYLGPSALLQMTWYPFFKSLSLLFLAVNLLVTAIIVIYGYRHVTTPGVRGKIRIVLLGCILSALPVITLTILPNALLHQPLVPYSFAFLLLIIIPLTYSYAIFRHRLIEVEKHVNRGATIILVYTILGFFSLLLYFVLDRLLPLGSGKIPLINTVLVLVLASVFVPLHRRIQIFVDKIFYGGWYDYRSAVSEITRGIEQIVDLSPLAETISERLAHTLHLEETCVFLRDAHGEFSVIKAAPLHGLQAQNPRNFPVLPRTSLSYLINIGAIEKNSLREALRETKLTPEEMQLLNSEQVHLWVPVIGHGQVLGLMALGPKFGGDIFSSEDLDILRTVARQMGPVIENIHLLTHLRSYTIELEQRVEERTAELHDAKKRVEAILASVGDGVAVIDLEGNFQTLNTAFEEQSGFHSRELIGKSFLKLLEDHNDPAVLNDMQSALSRGEVWSGELTSRRKGHGIYPTQLTIAPVRDQNGRIVSYVGSQRDITRQKELSRLKDQFVSDVSHELRTPTTNISLYLDLLENAPEERRPVYIQVLKEQTFLLRKLVEDILDLSRLAVGKSKRVEFMDVDLNSLVEDVIVAHQPQLEANQIRLYFEPEDQPSVQGDPNGLTRVITNLVSNAVRYTPQGEVTIKTYQKDDQVCLEVEDTGIGIDPEDQPHLFDRFYRGLRVRQSKIHGTGLGLAIAREIVQLHSGRIEFSSETGKGSTFRVWLPACREKICLARQF